MNAKNLKKTCATFDLFCEQLREAHTDAVNSENRFGELALFNLVEQAAQLKAKLDRVKEAANA